MTILWLIVWYLSGLEDITINPLNSWAIAFIICLGMDILYKVGTRDET